MDAAQRAVAAGQDELRHGLYARRWTVASEGQRQYMIAVAELLANGVSPTGGAVAASLGRRTPQLSRVRQELITRGFLTSERGVLMFTIPGMAAYVRAQGEGERAVANPEVARYVPGHARTATRRKLPGSAGSRSPKRRRRRATPRARAIGPAASGGTASACLVSSIRSRRSRARTCARGGHSPPSA